MSRKLRITLYATAAYLGCFGILFVFAPGVFEQITQSTLPDAKLTLLYGLYTLIFAYVAFMAGKEKDATGTLSRTVLLVTAANGLAFGYLLITGREGFPQGGPPLIVNAVLTVLLFRFRKVSAVVGG